MRRVRSTPTERSRPTSSSFGDGTSSGPLIVPQTTHTYSGGQFTARLVVTDADGATASRSLAVFVTTANLSPNGDILTPAAEAVTVSAGQSVSFTSAASDPDGHLPLSYAWDFGGMGTSTLPNPGAVVFPNAGTFLVTLRVTDAFQVSDPTPDTCRVSVLNPELSLAADQVHWTMSGPTSVTVDWRGPLGSLSYGLTEAYGTNVNAVTPGAAAVVFGRAVLGGSDRRPGGQHHLPLFHRRAAPDHTFHTPPARGSSGFTVVAEGDIGSASEYPNVAGVQAMVASQNPAFVLALGDLSYANENGIAACDDFFNDIMAWSTDAACMPIWGNHEWEKIWADDLRNYKGRFDLPNPQTTPDIPAPNDGGEDWYWFDHGNVRFIAYPEPFSGALDDWYPRARVLMQGAQADPAIAFVVTIGHRPAYSSGRHPGEERLQGYLDQLGAAFPKYVLNLNGHSHDYERTLPSWGVVHVTAGASGSPLEYSDVPVAGCKWDGGCPAPGWSGLSRDAPGRPAASLHLRGHRGERTWRVRPRPARTRPSRWAVCSTISSSARRRRTRRRSSRFPPPPTWMREGC
jgi:PKD repeat protein